MKKEENSNNQDHFENLSFISFLKNTLYTDSKKKKTSPVVKLSHERALFVKHNMMPSTI